MASIGSTVVGWVGYFVEYMGIRVWMGSAHFHRNTVAMSTTSMDTRGGYGSGDRSQQIDKCRSSFELIYNACREVVIISIAHGLWTEGQGRMHGGMGPL